MKKYLGIILVVLGALMLVISYFVDRLRWADLVDHNIYQVLALFLIIGGIVAHIVINKKMK